MRVIPEETVPVARQRGRPPAAADRARIVAAALHLPSVPGLYTRLRFAHTFLLYTPFAHAHFFFFFLHSLFLLPSALSVFYRGALLTPFAR